MTEGTILEGLQGEPFDDLFHALDGAVSHPTHRVVAALFRCARNRGGPGGYGAAAALFTIHGKIGAPEDWTFGPCSFGSPTSIPRSGTPPSRRPARSWA